MSGAAFFDLDRTLLDVNSGHLWLREEWRDGRLSARTAGRAIYWFTRYALGASDLDQAMDEAAALYRGEPEAEMAARVEAWFQRALRHRLRPGAVLALQTHRERGDVCVLATSSTQYAAAAAQQAFGLDDAISTRLASLDGVLDGTLAASAFGAHKLTRCAAWAEARGIALEDCTFYTDSASDLPLLERVGAPVVVNPDRRLRKLAAARGWPVVDWGAAPEPARS